MRTTKALLIAIFGLLTAEVAFAQKAKSFHTRTRYNYSATKVRGAKAKIICPVFQNSKYPYHGLGLKLGDPFALTYKYYANKNFSVVVDFGKAASGLYSKYFREQFNVYTQADTFSSSVASLEYLTHKVKSDFITEVKALYSLDASKISPGLQVYIGGGWEWKNASLQYDYLYENGVNENRFGRFSRNRYTMGPQITMGIEYAYFQLPISAFMELEYFMDVQADPGWQRFEGGVGLRYVF